ncbi:hypothetical protein C8R43DRAFT_1000684 [Mycena crocata]|nr:hypothetical protein C8R43DRAFT_1000684 [Mycena crocata]
MRSMQREPILDRLRAGYLPTPAEIEDTQRELASLSTELGRLEELIRDLSARRDEIWKSIELKQALIAPVRQIPDDVLQDIFLACLPTHRNAVMSTTESPLLLGRICSSWRALALATPRIWASLHIHIGFSIQSDDRIRAIAEWLERSAACPLSLSISDTFPKHPHFEPYPSDSYDAAEALLMGILISTVHRWQDMSLSDLSGSCFDAFHDISAPFLRTIRLKHAPDVTRWLKLFASPTVRTLELEVALTSEHTPLLLPSLSNITHLSIAHDGGDPWWPVGIPSILVFGILQNLTQLVSLNMTISDIWLPDRSTVLPVLQSLDLYGAPSEIPLFLEYLIMPSLLHFAADSMVIGRPTPSMWANFCEHSPQVRSLVLSFVSFTRETLRQTLQHLPSLAKLVVTDDSSGGWNSNVLLDVDYFLTLLAEPPETNLCPSLRTLEIRNCLHMTGEALVDFLQARVDVGGEFHLKIIFTRPANAAVLDVERFRQQGLDVSIVEPPSIKPPSSTAWTGLPEDAEWPSVG